MTGDAADQAGSQDAHGLTQKSKARSWAALLEQIVRHDLTSMAGALAFTAVFSFTPMLLAVTFLLSLAGSSTEWHISQVMTDLAGPQIGRLAEDALQGADRANISGPTAWLALGLTLFSASAAFAQLKWSLNRIWEVPESAVRGGVLGWIITRLSAIGLVLGLGFLFVLLLVVSSLLAAVVGHDSVWGLILGQCLAWVAYAGFFALLYRLLPSIKPSMQRVVIGALVSSLLFALGKLVLDTWLARSEPQGGFAAAGSLIAGMLWLYYASLIFFLGAEITCWLTPEPEKCAMRDASAAETGVSATNKPAVPR